jgi:flavin-dependent dehydrogenase
VPGGYVGVAPVGANRVNVCAVVESMALPLRRERAALETRGALGTGGALGTLAALAARTPLRLAVEDDADRASVVAESGTTFGTAHPLIGDLLLAGDAAALPHPLGGDGMAMAVRAGILAASHVHAFLQGHRSAAWLKEDYARAWQHEFRARLRWSSMLHGVLVRPALARAVVTLLGAWPAGMRLAVARTRGGPFAPDASARLFPPTVRSEAP